MSMTTGVISGMVAICALGVGYYSYNSKHKSKPEIKVKELKQEQDVKLSQKTYVSLNYVPKNTKPTPKTTYISNSNQSHKSNNYVEDDDNLLNSAIGIGFISSASDSDDSSHKHSHHSSHSYHDSHDSDSSSYSSYDSGGSCDSGGCDCSCGCD